MTIRNLYLVFIMLNFLWPGISWSVTIKDGKNEVNISSDQYKLTWKKAETMGYSTAIPSGSKKSLIQNLKDPFYHGGDYANWEFWGATGKVKILEQNVGKSVVEYQSKGTEIMAYSITATYWDAVPYFMHEVRGTNLHKEPQAFPVSGYDPMFNPGYEFKEEEFKIWKEPIPHVAIWQPNGYFIALYSKNPRARARKGDWQGKGSVVQLNHDWQLDMIDRKKQSEPVTYCVALAKGGEGEAHQLAAEIKTMFEGKEPKSVNHNGKIPVFWASIKDKH